MERLRELRKEKRISQQALADILHIGQQAVYKYENGITEPNIAMLKDIANIFEVSVDYLIGNTDCKHKVEEVTECELNDDEMKFLNNYRKISPFMRESISELMTEILVDKEGI